MESFYAVAELYSKNTRRGVAHSALPKAPVLPHVEPRHHLRRVGAMLRRTLRQPVIAVRPTRYSTEC